MLPWTRALGIWVGLTVTACAAPPADPPATGRLVILISLDTLRADHLGAYGYARPISPNIDALARRGVVFEDASATSPWTLPSHASMLTGLYPSRHGAVFGDRRLPPSVPTLTELLRSHGVETAAAVNCVALSPQNGLDRGFEHLLYVREDPEECSPTTAMTDQILTWADAARGRDAFLFFHDYDIHSDYCAWPAWEARLLRPYDGIVEGRGAFFKRLRLGLLPFGARDLGHLIDQYDAGIFQTDDELGRLVQNLQARGLLAQTTFVLVADHGEAFYEHGQLRHSTTQYQEMLRVPFIVTGPGIPAGSRVAAPVSLVDVAPTIAGLFGLAMTASTDGLDLGPTLHGVPPTDRLLFAQANASDPGTEPWPRWPVLGRPGDDLWMVRHGPHKLILDFFYERRELYVLDRDPLEREDLAKALPVVAQDLGGALERLRAESRAEVVGVVLSEEERERLDALGYLR